MIDSNGNIVEREDDVITFKQKLTAINESVDNWDDVARGGAEQFCPLCKLYKVCTKGCPIYEKTGKHRCAGTPYQEWFDTSYTDLEAKTLYAEKFRDWLKDLYIEVSEAGDGAPEAKHCDSPIPEIRQDIRNLSHRIVNIVPAIGKAHIRLGELEEDFEKLKRKIMYTVHPLPTPENIAYYASPNKKKGGGQSEQIK